MYKVLLAAVLAFSTAAMADGLFPGTSSRGGLTGFLFLPGSEVLDTGLLRFQARLDYLRLTGDGGSRLALPLSVTWGAAENLEVGGEIPFYLDDEAEDGSVLGDISAGCGWLYETASGGTNLVLKGELRLPTGTAGRDPGAELAVGCATGTTFRLFKLRLSAFYVLNGSRNPFEDHIDDYMRFSAGGTSYITEDLQLAASLEGTSAGSLDAAGTLAFNPIRNTVFFWTLRAGLDGPASYSMSVGAAWTGSGF